MYTLTVYEYFLHTPCVLATNCSLKHAIKQACKMSEKGFFCTIANIRQYRNDTIKREDVQEFAIKNNLDVRPYYNSERVRLLSSTGETVCDIAFIHYRRKTKHHKLEPIRYVSVRVPQYKTPFKIKTMKSLEGFYNEWIKK